LFFGILISLLNFSPHVADFIIKVLNWFPYFIYLNLFWGQVSFFSGIIFKSKVLDSLVCHPSQHLWIQYSGLMNFWRSHIALCFRTICVSVLQSTHLLDWLFFSLPLRGEKADSKNKISNSKTKQIFKCSKETIINIQ
jgi:hypothetical protein